MFFLQAVICIGRLRFPLSTYLENLMKNRVPAEEESDVPAVGVKRVLFHRQGAEVATAPALDHHNRKSLHPRIISERLRIAIAGGIRRVAK